MHDAKVPKGPTDYWPSMHKGRSDDQSLRMAQKSFKRAFDMTPPQGAKRISFTADSAFTKAPIFDLNDDSPIQQNFDSTDDHTDVTQTFTPMRVLRKWHDLDKLIELGLDYASADRQRGRNTTAWRAWVSFCNDIFNTSADRPMDPMSTPLELKLEDEWLAMRFVCALVEYRGISVRSAGQYFSTVQGVHAREHGVKLCGGLKLERLPQMLKGLRRAFGDKPRKLRRGITALMLKEGMDRVGLDPRNRLHANIRAALVVAFSGLLRSGEYTSKTGKIDERTILRKHIASLSDEELILMIWPCKNMNHQGGHTCPLIIGSGGEFVDAVAEVRNMLAVDNTSRTLDGSTPLFRDPNTNTPITYDTINKVIKQIVESMGENPDEFSTHSCRIGGATALFTAGASETVIRTMGRWSSDIYRLYVRACHEQCRAWTKKAASTVVSDLSGEFDEVDDY